MYKETSWSTLGKYRPVALWGLVGVNPFLQPFKVDYVNSAEQAIEMLKLGRVELAVLPEPIGKSAIKRLGYGGIHAVAPPLDTAFLYHFIHKRHMSLVPMLTKAILEQVQSN